MPICNKCFVDKPLDQYFVETKKKTGKQYRKKYCLDCFRKQARDWKANNRVPKKKWVQPVILTTPIVEEPHNHKVCPECNEVKHHQEFYYIKRTGNYFKKCKICINRITREGQRLRYDTRKTENGGSERVPVKPNIYADEYQKAQTFWVLELMGWKYNENGVWSKEGIKNKDKQWDRIVKEPKKEKPPRIIWKDRVDEVMNLKRKGLSSIEIAAKLGCSKTTILKLIKLK